MTDTLKKAIPAVIIIALLAAAAFFFFKQFKPNSKEPVEKEPITSSSVLTDTIDISELSTSKFTYNGIAEVYKSDKDGNKTDEINCYISYKATVKAGVDVTDISYTIDTDAKTLKVTLPEIIITASPVDQDHLSFIPVKAKVELKDALEACEEDAQAEASQSSDLIDSAETNLKSTIEGLLYPITNPNGYEIIWE